MKKSIVKSSAVSKERDRKPFEDGLKLAVADIRRFEPHLAGAHVGEFNTVVSCFSLDRRVVQNGLPEGLVLGEQIDIVSQGKHPVFLFVGVQSCVRWHAVPPYFCSVLGMRYREAVVAVPFVRRRETGGDEHFTAVKLYLDRTLPIYLGWIGALPKERAIFRKRRDNYRICAPGGAFLFEQESSDVGVPDGGLQELPKDVKDHFDTLKPFLSLPHLGQYFSAVRSIPMLAEYACCPFRFDLDAVRLRPVAVQGTCSRRFCQILPGDFNRPGLDTDPLGSFCMKTSWKIEPPGLCFH